MNKNIINKGENIQTIIDWLKNNNLSKIFLITDKNSFELSGSKSYIQPILNQYAYVHYNDFSENPNIEDVYYGIKIINNEKCDCCISIGGGSIIDMGKLISYLMEETTKDPNLIVQKKLGNVKRKIPICAIPTTAGSGAESTHFAVIYIDNKKHSLAHGTILPDIVNLNPKLSYTMSPYLKAITGLDALAQGIESFWSKNATIQSRKYSIAAIELVWNNLKQSVLINDFNAHKNVVIGSNLAGKAINIAKTTAAHALSYYFTTKHKIKHGHAVALTLGKVYQFNYEKATNSNNDKGQVFNKLNKLLGIEENPRVVIEDFISDLNVELEYSKLKVSISKELPSLKKDINIERLSNNLFKIDDNDFERLILNH